jgi:hypothetical protein
MKFGVILTFIILLVVSPAKAAVIFSDNFDAQADWVLPQHPECGYSEGSNTCGSATVPPTGWTGFYTETNCNAGNGTGNENLYISSYADAPNNTVACRSGKCITQWDERCTSNMVNSDGNIHKDLGGEYSNIFVRYYFRFSSTYPMTMNKKLMHVQHYSSGAPWQYAVSGVSNYGNQPLYVGNFFTYGGTLEPGGGHRGYCGGGANETSTHPPAFSCYNHNYGTPAETYPDWDSVCDSTGLSCLDVGGDYPQRVNWIKSPSAQTLLRDGNWHYLEYQMKMNTWDGSAFNLDGETRMWIDGVLKLVRTNIAYLRCYEGICSEQRGFRMFGLGGNSYNDTVDSGENWYAIDDVCISDSYIGDTVCGAGGDTTPPVITAALPSGVQPCPSHPQTVTLSLTTDEASTCKYHTSDVIYDSMPNTFSTTGSTSHSQSVTLGCNQDYTFYARCSDSAGNKDTTSTTISFSVRQGKAIHVQ